MQLARTMSVSSVHVSIVLSVVCLGVVLVGGWYLQSSMIQQHFYDQEQIEELNKQITKQNDYTTQQIERLNIIVNALLHNSGKVSREIYTTNRESFAGLNSHSFAVLKGTA